MEVIVTLLERVTKTSLKSPSNASVEGAFYLSGRGVDEVRQEFQVLPIQQILAANGEFRAPPRPPAEASVHRVVTGYIDAREPICVSNFKIVFKMFRKIDGGPNVELMTGAYQSGIVCRRIQTV
jgi:hypothetical protein